MNEKVENLMLEILKQIQGRLGRIETQLVEHDSRFDRLEDLVRKQRRDTAGLLVMAKSVTGDFAEQVALIEERVSALEAQGGR